MSENPIAGRGIRAYLDSRAARLLIALQNEALSFLRRLLFRRDPSSPERILILRTSRWATLSVLCLRSTA